MAVAVGGDVIGYGMFGHEKFITQRHELRKGSIKMLYESLPEQHAATVFPKKDHDAL